ncbi:hypothetical protein H0H93_002478 [Arthromyces matolae]|nr:hypothetical protein H0H93_002478 [Arthromyces matolae]
MTTGPKAIWSDEDEKKFLELLLYRKSAAGDGGNFKEAVFQEVSDVLTPLVTKGGPKTVKACQNKWSAFRRIFRVITAIKGVSGWTWSNDTGASITPETESSWAAYVKIHKDAKPFKTRGWCHFDAVSQVMPTTIHGAHVFRPSNSTVGLGPSIDDDMASVASIDASSATTDSAEAPESAKIVDNVDTDFGGQDSTLAADSDVEDVDITQVLIMTPRRSKKRSAVAPPSTAAPSSKRMRVTGATALEGLAISLGHFGDAIVKALAPTPSDAAVNSALRAKAILHAQTMEKDLTTMELLAFINLLEKDSNAVGVYLALEDVEFRKAWVQMKVNANPLL